MLPRPTTFDELMRVQHLAAVNVSGADKSCWNGRIGPTTPGEDGWVVLGDTTWDNTILYHERVVQRLREMFDNQGVPQDAETRMRYRHAIGIVFHENAHLLAAHGTDHQSSMSIYQVSPAIKALDEGTREAYTHTNLDRYIDELHLDEIVPGIKDVAYPSKYPVFTPGTQSLAHELGKLTGLGDNETLRRLVVVTPAQQWPVAARLVFEGNDLDRLVPDRAGLIARSEIEAAMKRQFARLGTLTDGPLLSTQAKSVMVGNYAYAAGQRAAHKIRQQYGGAPGVALSGVTPLHTAHRLTSTGRPPTTNHTPTERSPETGR
jgi:hypothetical protein